MSKDDTPADSGTRRGLVLGFVVLVAGGFLFMIRDYLLAIFLAAIFSAMLHPIYDWVAKLYRKHDYAASATVLAGFVIAVGLPLIFIVGLVAREGVALSETLLPWFREQIANGGTITDLLPGWVPFVEALEPYRAQIAEQLSGAAQNVGSALFDNLTRVTTNAVDTTISLFVFLYAMFFFLMKGPTLLQTALQYLPISEDERDEVIERGLGVARATLKSILVIGLLQGVLVGLAFWLAGVPGAFFWGAIVVVMAAIPILGTPIVWGPAAIWLMANGNLMEGLALAAWGTLVVGLADNLLRPRIVGRQTRLPDLVVLVSILGGIGAFGAVGILVGPMLAAMFFVVLDIYHRTFSDILPKQQNGPLANDD